MKVRSLKRVGTCSAGTIAAGDGGRIQVWGRGAGRLAIGTVLTLVAAGCGGAAEGTSDADSFTIAIGEPDSLVPGASGTDASSRVVNALFTGLVRYAPRTSQPMLAVAESIRSSDQRRWTIDIEKGWTFHNGELVTSENFVRAWNATAYGPNHRAGSRLLSRIKGHDELNGDSADSAAPADRAGAAGAAGADETAKPGTPKLAGLEVVDDYTFTVTLEEPFSQFPMMLGQPAFYPLPKTAFENPDRFASRPTGNGPYQMAESWDGEGGVSLTAYEDYAKEYEDYGGELAANVQNLEYSTFPDSESAYRALLDGKVDIVPSVPPRLMGDADEDVGDRFLVHPGARLEYLGIPAYDKRFDDPRLRHALSLAIDREQLNEQFFAGTRTPATSLISPTIPGGREEACGQWCEYDPERARRLFERAGGFEGTLTLWTVSGTGDKPWMKAVGRMLRENLGIRVTIRAEPPTKYASTLAARQVTGPWLASGAPAYPSPHSFLRHLFTSDGSGNRTGYADSRVDAEVRKGEHASSVDAGMRHYQRAADRILRDMPVIPLWFSGANAAYSTHISDVSVDAFGNIQLARVQTS